MTVITTGTNANSYITIDEANALLLTCSASFMTPGTQLATDNSDDAYLIEAARDLEYLWSWSGQVADSAQPLAWPRQNVPKPGQIIPREPGWDCFSSIWNDYGTGWSPFDSQMDAWLLYKIQFLGGTPQIATIDSTIVPQPIKECQALLAVLRKTGGNLLSDNQGDSQGMQLPGGLKISYVNAIKQSADIHKRAAQFGQFIGGDVLGSPC